MFVPRQEIEVFFMNITMPSLNDIGEDDATVTEVLVEIGDTIAKGDTVMMVEMTKSVVEIESPYDGKVSKIHVTEEDEIKVGQVLVELE
jgi:pyruvate dehydrogenase E2 component (dihydrolipoamide acetyltransferase)